MAGSGRHQLEVVVLGAAEVGLAQALWSTGLRPLRTAGGPAPWGRPGGDLGCGGAGQSS